MVLMACGATIFLMGPRFGRELSELMIGVFRQDFSSRMDLGGAHLVQQMMWKSIQVFGAVGVPICFVGFLVGAFGSFIQTGPVFSFDPITPDLEKINPLQGFFRIFSRKQAIEGLRIIFKTIVILSVSAVLLKSQVISSLILVHGEPGFILENAIGIVKTLFAALVTILAVFAGFDFWMQRFEFQKSVRMTKQEAKQEHKEREGDPQIRARIRSIQREMARKRMMEAVKKADVVVTNPTHIAVALQYDKSVMSAPRVIAKGADLIAQKIKKIASDAGIPMVENVPLARSLFKSVKVGQVVPKALYQAVAEVLAYVYKLRNRKL